MFKLTTIPVLLIALAVPLKAADPIVWRTDYDSARKSVQEKPAVDRRSADDGVHVLPENGSHDARRPGLRVNLAVKGNFIALKIDGNKIANLPWPFACRRSPLVLGGPTARFMRSCKVIWTADYRRDHLKRTVLAVATPEWIGRDLELAKVVAIADYPATGLLSDRNGR
ncbi:MAG: hypothetical protein U0798_11095 [Gemmataceae bacterium]